MATLHSMVRTSSSLIQDKLVGREKPKPKPLSRPSPVWELTYARYPGLGWLGGKRQYGVFRGWLNLAARKRNEAFAWNGGTCKR
jgi:hypothetical protein